MIDYSENEGVCANAGPHSQKLHDRVTNICRNRMRQQSRSAMEPPQHEATSCQIDVVTSRQVSMSFTAVFHYNNSWNCLLLACSRTHTFSQMNPCLIRLFAVTPGLGPGKFKLKINKYNFQALFLVYCTNHLFGQEITRKESKKRHVTPQPGDPMIVIKNSPKRQRWEECHASLLMKNNAIPFVCFLTHKFIFIFSVCPSVCLAWLWVGEYD